jgi:hypothetical protein
MSTLVPENVCDIALTIAAICTLQEFQPEGVSPLALEWFDWFDWFDGFRPQDRVKLRIPIGRADVVGYVGAAQILPRLGRSAVAISGFGCSGELSRKKGTGRRGRLRFKWTIWMG